MKKKPTNGAFGQYMPRKPGHRKVPKLSRRNLNLTNVQKRERTEK